MSLRFRLTLFFTLFLAIVLVVVAVAVYALTHRSLVDSVEERARQVLRELVVNPLDEGVQALPSDAYFVLGLYVDQPRTAEQMQEDVSPFDGRLLAGSRRANPTASPTPEEFFGFFSEEDYGELIATGSMSRQVDFRGGTYLLRATTGEFERLGQRYPSTAIIGMPVAVGALDQLRSDLVRTVSIAFIVFAVGVWFLSLQAISPLKRVTMVASRVSGEDLSQRVPVPRARDEVGELAITLNHMLDRLQESFVTQRRFTADASHELRTPVTAIVGHANYLLRRTKPSPEQVDSLTVIRREAERMAKLVNDLLELARADAGFTVEKQPMNLVDVVEAVHMEIVPVAGHAEIDVSAAQPMIHVSGDEGRLKQVVLNLVQNALNAGADRISVSLAREKDWVRLEVLDNGPGIPENAIPHLFDRFYRVDGARSTRGNGSGLGLAIVRWIVEQHHGRVEVESRLGEGTVFTVLLPAFDAKQPESRSLPVPKVRTTAESA